MSQLKKYKSTDKIYKQIVKYKTCLTEVHKQLNIDGLSKSALEEQVKKIAEFDKYDKQTIEVLITILYLVADEMNCELQEDKEIKFNW